MYRTCICVHRNTKDVTSGTSNTENNEETDTVKETLVTNLNSNEDVMLLTYEVDKIRKENTLWVWGFCSDAKLYGAL